MGYFRSIFRRQCVNLALLAVLTGLVLNCLLGPDGPRVMVSLAQERALLLAENERLQAENGRLGVQINKLRSDPAYLQQIIRQQLGYARPDEFVYYFRSDGTSLQ